FIRAMRVFLSYASEDRELVEAIYLSLRSQGHTVFFDRADLPPGQEYDARIRRGIERSQLFIFLISPYSLDAGSYTLTELGIAQKTWEHPAGSVLPVVVRSTPLDQIPAYLKSVTLLEPHGNVVATVADAVHRIALECRRALLRKVFKGVAAASIVVGAAYFYWVYREPGREITGQDGAPAVAVPAGNFTMGDDEESPLREIYLDAFYIDKYEVTVARYAKFLKTTGNVRLPEDWKEASLDGANELPVVGVDWHDADAYCKWAGKRLPTEAEWEKAARGTDGRRYPWGNDEPTSSRANFGKSSAVSPYKGGLAPVGSREAGSSPYGVQDLAGNAGEWVADWFGAGFRRGDLRNPKGPENGTDKVIRGGGWYDPPVRLNLSRRMHASPDNRAHDVGFRCANDFGR
ncbi:MAG TPA: SUMF1/EgtB/PvdO family nonheme iron enzyme, partial [Candidatus Binatia bacterium]|nr:SUMF1/EgtB/PvdO family nonheme iron enzyme [Candidatus Binatia bacterium]